MSMNSSVQLNCQTLCGLSTIFVFFPLFPPSSSVSIPLSLSTSFLPSVYIGVLVLPPPPPHHHQHMHALSDVFCSCCMCSPLVSLALQYHVFCKWINSMSSSLPPPSLLSAVLHHPCQDQHPCSNLCLPDWSAIGYSCSCPTGLDLISATTCRKCNTSKKVEIRSVFACCYLLNELRSIISN